MLSSDLLGSAASDAHVSVSVDAESGRYLNKVLSVYAKENPDADVITMLDDGTVKETPADSLQCVVTDDMGNVIGVVSDNKSVVDADGNVVGAVHGDGTFVEGASGIGSDGQAYYHVIWGDTLCKVSSAVHYSVQELAAYNHIDDVHMIYAESDIRIPPDGWENLSE